MKFHLELAVFVLLAGIPLKAMAGTNAFGEVLSADEMSVTMSSQNDGTVSVRGTVRDAAGVPLPGVVVLVKDRPSSGVLTDAEADSRLRLRLVLCWCSPAWATRQLNCRRPEVL